MAKIIAIDIGLKRIGLALSDGKVVLPLNPILRQNRKQAARDVSAVLSEYCADCLVVGVPMGLDSQSEMQKRAQHFVGLLSFSGKVVYVDESFSSKEASSLQASAGANDKAKDGRLDSLAAMIILQRYLGI